MSSITIKTNHAFISGRDESGTWSKKIEITAEQHQLAFQGAQEAQKIIKGIPLDITASYEISPYNSSWAELAFVVTASTWLSKTVYGRCHSPLSAEKIGTVIADAVIAELKSACRQQALGISRIQDALNDVTLSI